VEEIVKTLRYVILCGGMGQQKDAEKAKKTDMQNKKALQNSP
jgi:hypothetical protein